MYTQNISSRVLFKKEQAGRYRPSTHVHAHLSHQNAYWHAWVDHAYLDNYKYCPREHYADTTARPIPAAHSCCQYHLSFATYPRATLWVLQLSHREPRPDYTRVPLLEYN